MEKSSNEKEPKQCSSSAAPASSQEPSSDVSAGMATPDSGFQAYSPMPPHGFVASSPQPHPYMWGVQHMMPPYGTPPHPYVTMYPPGGMYTHPSMPPGSYYAMPSPNGVTEASGNTSGGTEGDSKQSDVKDKLPIKRSKESGESASDGTNEGSDTNTQNDSGSRQDRKDASENGGSRNGSVGTSLPRVSQTVPIMPKTATGVPTSAAISRDSGHSQPLLQDVRELKRQRRKQSNRDAAQRSRLRKQAECDELAQRTEVLNAENASLRAERNRLKRQFEELTSENTSLKDQFLSFPPLEGIKMEKDDQEPDTNQTGFTETKFVSYKDST